MSAELKAVCRAAAGEVIETAWGRLVWTASGQVGNAMTMSLGRATIFAGKENPRHRHPNCDEILHLVAGRLEHTQGEHRCVLEPGDTVCIPKGVWHQARALGGCDAEIVICFDSPDRLTEVDSSILGNLP
ncbi:MAG: cupin domain-containing protein [Chthoniobacter sp.]|uniref:cupin domain-containing protein n=1 Tax=Chthoniobacter sp. TaxID=2510640 RepID=UPI0032AC88AA